MNDQATLARGWLLKADSDLADAQRTVASQGPYDTGCFHAQQAIEKSLKAFLAYHRRPIPRTHDLEELGRLCQQIAPLPELPLAELADASDYAVHIRYDLDVWPSQDEARHALQLGAC
jgi:HEPN domain-containing protein